MRNTEFHWKILAATLKKEQDFTSGDAVPWIETLGECSLCNLLSCLNNLEKSWSKGIPWPEGWKKAGMVHNAAESSRRCTQSSERFCGGLRRDFFQHSKEASVSPAQKSLRKDPSAPLKTSEDTPGALSCRWSRQLAPGGVFSNRFSVLNLVLNSQILRLEKGRDVPLCPQKPLPALQ